MAKQITNIISEIAHVLGEQLNAHVLFIHRKHDKFRILLKKKLLCTDKTTMCVHSTHAKSVIFFVLFDECDSKETNSEQR